MNQPRYAPRPEEPIIVVDAAPQAPSGSGYHQQHPAVAKALDGVLTVQRPIVLAHLRRIRSRHPGATPQQLTEMLERHYLATVMAGGAGVGAAAAIPAVGTAAALALAGAETLGFIEATALFAHAVAEVHGIVLTDRDRTHALILALMLGDEGATLLRQVTGQVAGGMARNAFWSEIVTTAMPKNLVGPAVDQLRSMFLKKLAKTGTASVIGKAIPYGVGAVIGGTGNRLLGKKVVRSARQAFGPAPFAYPEVLAQVPPRQPRAVRQAERKQLAAGKKQASLERKQLALEAKQQRKQLALESDKHRKQRERFGTDPESVDLP
ncbi:hypothetical protein ACFSWE_14125 [Leucobacter albus]|uniref:EcsC family protein n=1 Tax=Leucobacter albus TaxID=272210 RepID=A0ABW3TKT1_9MICO